MRLTILKFLWSLKQKCFEFNSDFHLKDRKSLAVETAVLWNTPYYILKNLIICFYHVTYAFQSEYTPLSCLNVKELPARNRRDI